MLNTLAITERIKATGKADFVSTRFGVAGWHALAFKDDRKVAQDQGTDPEDALLNLEKRLAERSE